MILAAVFGAAAIATLGAAVRASVRKLRRAHLRDQVEADMKRAVADHTVTLR